MGRVAQSASPIGRGLISSAKLFRPEDFRRSDHPVCAAIRWLRDNFLDRAATPPFQGGGMPLDPTQSSNTIEDCCLCQSKFVVKT